MSRFHTEVATMKTASQRVNEVAANIHAEMQSLDNRIQPVTSTWRGSGATAYLNLHSRWMTNVQNLRRVLEEIAQGIDQNANTYQTTDDSVMSDMSRVAGQL